jgi:hypothetical protein
MNAQEARDALLALAPVGGVTPADLTPDQRHQLLVEVKANILADDGYVPRWLLAELAEHDRRKAAQAAKGFAGLAELMKAAQPTGGGWQAIPGGKHGGFRKPDGGGGWEYWYPGQGHAKDAAKHHKREAKKTRRRMMRRLGKLSTEELIEHLDAHEEHAQTAHQAKIEAVRIKATKKAAKVQAKIRKQLKRAGASDEEIADVLRSHAHHSGMAGAHEGKGEKPDAKPGEEGAPKESKEWKQEAVGPAQPQTFPELVQQAMQHPKVLAAIEAAVREAQGKGPAKPAKTPPESPQEAPGAPGAGEEPQKPAEGAERKDVDVRPKRKGKPQIVSRAMDAHRGYLERQLEASRKLPKDKRNAALERTRPRRRSWPRSSRRLRSSTRRSTPSPASRITRRPS